MLFRLIETMISGPLSESGRVRTAAAIDASCAAAITFISAVPYLSHLGFYSDDWGLLARFSASSSQSFAALVSDYPARPIQGIYLTLLFRAFGLNPLGYHLVNAAVLAASAALLCLLLVRLCFGRAQSFATTLLFVMLPQLSTVRVWYAAFQVPLSMALMLISMHCQLSFARSGKIGWLGGAIIAAVLSVGAYEIFAPLIAGFAIALLFLRWRRSNGTVAGPRIAAAALVLALIMLAFVYKLVLSGGRAGPVADPERYLLGLQQLFRIDYDWRVDSGLNLLATPRTHFWAPLEGWWTGAGALLGGATSFEVAAIALLIAAVVVWRLRVTEAQRRSASRRLLLLGIAAFLLGNATFLIVPSVVFTSTGMDNRVQVAAAIGVAMIFAALISLGTNALPPRRRGITFCAVIAVISASAFARMSTIEHYWADAPALQQKVLTAARADLQSLPPNSTVILDGVCPYFGPAVVFETSWDVGGALALALARPVAGDAVSSRMSLNAKGLQTSMYKEPSFYPYGPELYIYNPSKHQVVQLNDAETAVRYFANRRPTSCPGLIARGAEV